MNLPHIDLKEYNYDLPDDRIAQYPAGERDMSKLLLFNGSEISHDVFRNLPAALPEGSLLVFNNTRVIRARLFFRKDTGAIIEILCLEPVSPAGYDESFGSQHPVEWKCLVGNLKKWKSGTLVSTFSLKGQVCSLNATRIAPEGDAWRIRFGWEPSSASFGEVIDSAGNLPLPPYIGREAGPEDHNRYQTVYSKSKGSVAAPTAGLHFTGQTLDSLGKAGITTTELTLHVGAGTFKPIKARDITDHEMHTEHFTVTRSTIEKLIACHGKIIAVGTTSVRTLESLYWLGVKLQRPTGTGFEPVVRQWEPYCHDTLRPATEALGKILEHMSEMQTDSFAASTTIMIVPSYRFRMISGMVTNFHQPMSSLLLLVSAWTGNKWKDIYRYAIDNDFRFLSYGDSSLLLASQNNDTGS